MAALPFDLAVQVFDEPELNRHRCEIIRHIDPRRVGPLIEAMSSDQQAETFSVRRPPSAIDSCSTADTLVGTSHWSST